MQKVLIFLLLVLQVVGSGFAAPDQRSAELHDEVVVRLIGHHVLLYAGDSVSQVLPVQRDDNTFTLSFANAFGFQPEGLGHVIDSVITSASLSRYYIVAFISCDSDKVVYSYERGKPDDIIPCLGRPQPKACYRLQLTLLDKGSADQLHTPKDKPSQAGGDAFSFVMLMVVLLAFAAGVAISWRSQPRREVAHYAIGKLQFDPNRMVLIHGHERIELTGKEAELLSLLYQNKNNTIERDTILKEVWGDDGDYVGRTLDVFISKLRKKLETDPDVQILNVRGVGYKLVGSWD